jgi:hypothetical protein
MRLVFEIFFGGVDILFGGVIANIGGGGRTPLHLPPENPSMVQILVQLLLAL